MQVGIAIGKYPLNGDGDASFLYDIVLYSPVY
jgi:hypothetical protein